MRRLTSGEPDQRLPAQSALAISQLQGHILGELAARLSAGTLREASPTADSLLLRLRDFDLLILGGSVATSAYGRAALRTSAHLRASQLLKTTQAPAIWVPRENTFDLGALGAWYAGSAEDRATVDDLAREASRRGESFVIIACDIGATTTHVISVLGKPKSIRPHTILHKSTYPTPRSAPAEFYIRLGEEIAAHLHRSRSLSILPIIFVGHPGNFSAGNAAIVPGTARNLGARKGEFSNVRPAAQLRTVLETLGFDSFRVSVCNDGQAQLAASVVAAQDDFPIGYRSGNVVVYMGLGTGLGFAAGRLNDASCIHEQKDFEIFDCAAIGPLKVKMDWLAGLLAPEWESFLDTSIVLNNCDCWGDLLSGHFLSVCMGAVNRLNKRVIFESLEPSALSDIILAEIDNA